MEAELLSQVRNIVGESAIWDHLNGRLLWIDIIGKKIHSLHTGSGQVRSWDTPEFVTSIGMCDDGSAIVGLTKEVCRWSYDDVFEPFCCIETNHPQNRLNEGVVGPDGAFWVGTMQNNIEPDGSPKEIEADTGKLYRCTPAGEVIELSADLFGITNTLVWTAQGDLVTADTLKNEFYKYRYDPQTSRLSARSVLQDGFHRGLPDGSTMDAEGCIWNCRVGGGGCVIRIAPDGSIDRVVDLPCSWPTSCAFGGEKLDTLYVTSARFTMDQAHLEKHPQEGGLFAIKVDVTGVQSNLFG